VPLKHLRFDKACKFGERTTKNHPYNPTARNYHKRKRGTDANSALTFKATDRTTPSPEGPDTDMEAIEEEAKAIFFEDAPLPLFLKSNPPTSTPQSELDKMPLLVMTFSTPSITDPTPLQFPTGMQYPNYDELDLPGASLYYDEPNILRAGLVRSVEASVYEGGNVTQQWGGTNGWGDPRPWEG
jgi:hypothetical protein